MREACKFNVQIHNRNILKSSVTKDPGVSSILLFSGSGINFPRPLYFTFRDGASLAPKIPRWEQRGHCASRSANPGGQGGTSGSGQAAHVSGGGGTHGGSSTRKFYSNSIKKYCSQTNAGDKNSVKLLTQKLQPAFGKRRKAARRWWLQRRSRLGHPAKTGQPAPPPSASWPQAPVASRRLRFESKRKTKILFQRNFPTHHPLNFFLRLREGCIL
jgi:hypothetical protein